MAEIVRLFDGAIAPVGSVSKHFYEETPIEEHNGLLKILKNIRDYTSDILEQTTLKDLM